MAEVKVYVATENTPVRRAVIFESAAQSEDGILRAAAKAVKESFHEDSNPLIENGYTITMDTAIATVRGTLEIEAEKEAADSP